ncbi:MAG TPA: P-loop NTPase [Actinomycetes bacterium]
MAIVVDLDPSIADILRTALGSDTEVLPSVDALRHHLVPGLTEDTVVFGPTVDLPTALSVASEVRVLHPSIGVILVRRRVDASVLAEALRAGVRDVVEERDLSGLAEAARRSRVLSRRLRSADTRGGEHASPGHRGHIVTVFSAKGGCGKTTLATNLAAILADHGRREVCILDLDLAFGDVAIVLQLFPAHTLADAVALGDSLDADGLKSLITRHSPGLSALVAPVEPGTAGHIPAELIGRMLEILRDQFDYVVVDTPPAFDDQVLAAFDRSDIIANIATLDIPAIKNLKLTLETLELLNYSRDRWVVVLNRADSKVGLTAADVEKTLNAKIVAQIPSSREVPSTINRGVPIALDQPNHPVSQAIRQFAERYVVVGPSVDDSVPSPLRHDRRHRFGRKSSR